MGTALVVDDSSTERQIISSCLQKEGINVLIATSGEEALEKIKDTRPDVIVLDVVLPGRSGFEICRELKAETSTRSIPVIICSTKGSEMDKFWGMKQGADVYITKPFTRDQLIRAVQSVGG